VAGSICSRSAAIGFRTGAAGACTFPLCPRARARSDSPVALSLCPEGRRPLLRSKRPWPPPVVPRRLRSHPARRPRAFDTGRQGSRRLMFRRLGLQQGIAHGSVTASWGFSRSRLAPRPRVGALRDGGGAVSWMMAKPSPASAQLGRSRRRGLGVSIETGRWLGTAGSRSVATDVGAMFGTGHRAWPGTRPRCRQRSSNAEQSEPRCVGSAARRCPLCRSAGGLLDRLRVTTGVSELVVGP